MSAANGLRHMGPGGPPGGDDSEQGRAAGHDHGGGRRLRCGRHGPLRGESRLRHDVWTSWRRQGCESSGLQGSPHPMLPVRAHMHLWTRPSAQVGTLAQTNRWSLPFHQPRQVATNPYILSGIILVFDFVVGLFSLTQFKYAGAPLAPCAGCARRLLAGEARNRMCACAGDDQELLQC